MKICPDCKRQWEDWIELCFVDGTPLQPLHKQAAAAPPLPALPEYTDEIKKSLHVPEEDNEPTFIPNNTPLPPPPEARGLEAPHTSAAPFEPVVDDTPLESVVPSILPPVDENTSDTESHFIQREYSVSAFQTLMPMDEEEGRATPPLYPPVPGNTPPSMARGPVQEAASDVAKAPEKTSEKAPEKTSEATKAPEAPKPPESPQATNRAPVGMAVAGLTAVGVVIAGMLLVGLIWKLTHIEAAHVPATVPTAVEPAPPPAPAVPAPAVPAPAVPAPAAPAPTSALAPETPPLHVPAPVVPPPVVPAAVPVPPAPAVVPTPAPAVIGEGILTIIPTPADAKIFVDGVDSGQGVISVSLPFGKHDIKIVREGYHTETTTVDFKRNMSLPRKLSPEAVPVSVALDCADTAPCSVVIDDKPSIKLPTNQALPAGRHSFRLTNGDGEMCTVYRDLAPDTAGTPAQFTLECP